MTRYTAPARSSETSREPSRRGAVSTGRPAHNMSSCVTKHGHTWLSSQTCWLDGSALPSKAVLQPLQTGYAYGRCTHLSQVTNVALSNAYIMQRPSCATHRFSTACRRGPLARFCIDVSSNEIFNNLPCPLPALDIEVHTPGGRASG